MPCSFLWTVPIYMPYPCVYAVLVHFRRWTSWHPTRRTTQNNSGIESLFCKGFISLKVQSIFVQAVPLLANTKDHCYLVYYCKCLLRSTTTNYESNWIPITTNDFLIIHDNSQFITQILYQTVSTDWGSLDIPNVSTLGFTPVFT